jgi:hypothetical protein
VLFVVDAVPKAAITILSVRMSRLLFILSWRSLGMPPVRVNSFK